MSNEKDHNLLDRIVTSLAKNGGIPRRYSLVVVDEAAPFDNEQFRRFTDLIRAKGKGAGAGAGAARIQSLSSTTQESQSLVFEDDRGD